MLLVCFFNDNTHDFSIFWFSIASSITLQTFRGHLLRAVRQLIGGLKTKDMNRNKGNASEVLDGEKSGDQVSICAMNKFYL